MGNEELNFNLRKVAKASFFVFTTLVLSKLITYAYRIIIARQYGPSEYGLFSLALVIVSLFTAFASFGLYEGIVRYVSIFRGLKKEKEVMGLYKFSLSLLLVSSMFFTIFLFMLSDFISINILSEANLSVYLRYFSLAIIPIVLSYVFLGFLRAYEHIGWYSFLFNFFQNFVKLSCLILLVFLGWSSRSIQISYLAGVFSLAIFAYIMCRYKISNIFLENKGSSLKKSEKVDLLSYSWPLMVFLLFYNIFFWTDTIFLGFFKSSLEVGLYNAAVPLAGILLVMTEVFMQIFFPLVSKNEALGKKDIIEGLTKQIIRWSSIVNAFLLLLFIFFSNDIISLLFGNDYLSASMSLKILSAGLIFYSIAITNQQLISSMGRSKTVLANIFLASLVNIILNLILIPRTNLFGIDNSFGINGAAMSTSISVIFLAIISTIQAKRKFGFKIITSDLIKILSVIVISCFLLINLEFSHFLINILILIFSYSILTILFGLVKEEDLHILNSIKKRIWK